MPAQIILRCEKVPVNSDNVAALMKSVQVLMKEISFKSQMDVWWQRTGSALAIVGGIGATYGAWFELPSIKSDNKDFKNQTMEFNNRLDESIKESNRQFEVYRRFDQSVRDSNRRFDRSLALGVTVPIAVSVVMGFIC